LGYWLQARRNRPVLKLTLQSHHRSIHVQNAFAFLHAVRPVNVSEADEQQLGQFPASLKQLRVANMLILPGWAIEDAEWWPMGDKHMGVIGHSCPMPSSISR